MGTLIFFLTASTNLIGLYIYNQHVSTCNSYGPNMGEYVGGSLYIIHIIFYLYQKIFHGIWFMIYHVIVSYCTRVVTFVRTNNYSIAVYSYCIFVFCLLQR